METCGICYEPFAEDVGGHFGGHRRRRLLCGHVFCAECIRTWKASGATSANRPTSATCPYCREPLSRKYHREKNDRERRHRESVQHVNRLIAHVEKVGCAAFRDGEEFQTKLYQLYERLDTLEDQKRSGFGP